MKHLLLLATLATPMANATNFTNHTTGEILDHYRVTSLITAHEFCLGGVGSSSLPEANFKTGPFKRRLAQLYKLLPKLKAIDSPDEWREDLQDTVISFLADNGPQEVIRDIPLLTEPQAWLAYERAMVGRDITSYPIPKGAKDCASIGKFADEYLSR